MGGRQRKRFIDAEVLEHNHNSAGPSCRVDFSLHHRQPDRHGLQGRHPAAVAKLQDDNAETSRARVVNNFLQHQQINRMDWPARSPDFNPIKPTWHVLGRRIRANHPPKPNFNRLFKILPQKWQVISQKQLSRCCIRTMRQSCLDCINASSDSFASRILSSEC